MVNLKMPNLKPTFILFFPFFISIFNNAPFVSPKSTIEPCSNSDSCNALLGYTLYTDLKVSELASLFQIDPIALLTANSIDISYPDVENHILPSQLFVKIPISCSCVDGIRKSVSTRYKTRPSDTLSNIADTIYSGLVSADQIREANSITDPSVLDVGQNLVVPLPCTCFNNTDNSLPAIYLSYVVKPVDTLAGIAAEYSTTVTDLMNVNAMGGTSITPGDILAVPLPVYTACQLHWQFHVRACNAETVTLCSGMSQHNKVVRAAMLLLVTTVVLSMAALLPGCPHRCNLDALDHNKSLHLWLPQQQLPGSRYLHRHLLRALRS